MNPFWLQTPWDYEETYQWALGFVALVIFGGALLAWHWWWRPAPKNHWAYAALALALLTLVPVEQLIGSRLAGADVDRLVLLARYGRYAFSGVALALAVVGLARMYRAARHRPMGGQIAAVLAVVLALIVGVFNYVGRFWPEQERVHLPPRPDTPATRGGYYCYRTQWEFVFVVPSRDWSEELAPVRGGGAVVEQVERVRNVRTRVFVEGGQPSLLDLRDHCVADMKLINPNVIMEKEEPLDISGLKATRILGRAASGDTELRFYSTVYSSPKWSYRMVTWCTAAAYERALSDIEIIHKSFQLIPKQR